MNHSASNRRPCPVLQMADVDWHTVACLLASHDLQLQHVPPDAAIPGSFWGEPEAGVIANRVYARFDTPVHSLLHEACHLIVLPLHKRLAVHTNATRCAQEEDAVCYLQILLAAQLADVGSLRIMQDMDTWGYNFRLGSAQAWFEHDAEDARAWLEQRRLLPH